MLTLTQKFYIMKLKAMSRTLLLTKNSCEARPASTKISLSKKQGPELKLKSMRRRER
jgi:hypothetical protein